MCSLADTVRVACRPPDDLALVRGDEPDEGVADVGEGEGVAKELLLLGEGEARGQIVERPHAPVHRSPAHVLAAEPDGCTDLRPDSASMHNVNDTSVWRLRRPISPRREQGKALSRKEK